MISHPFGIYVADDVQKIQMAIIANCRDETTTRIGVQTFFNWLDAHGEIKYLVQRAARSVYRLVSHSVSGSFTG